MPSVEANHYRRRVGEPQRVAVTVDDRVAVVF